jgi:hypothetical protein
MRHTFLAGCVADVAGEAKQCLVYKEVMLCVIFLVLFYDEPLSLPS